MWNPGTYTRMLYWERQTIGKDVKWVIELMRVKQSLITLEISIMRSLKIEDAHVQCLWHFTFRYVFSVNMYTYYPRYKQLIIQKRIIQNILKLEPTKMSINYRMDKLNCDIFYQWNTIQWWKWLATIHKIKYINFKRCNIKQSKLHMHIDTHANIHKEPCYAIQFV